jgi:hypothetical protein
LKFLSILGTTPTKLFFNASDVVSAWGLLLKASTRLGHLDTFNYDLVDVTMQSLSTFALTMYKQMITAYKASNVSAFNKHAEDFDGIMLDMEDILRTNYNFLLGPWLGKSLF